MLPNQLIQIHNVDGIGWRRTTRVTYICENCGGKTVTRDAWAEWDERHQDWVLGAAYDYAFCHDCHEETNLEEVELTEDTTAQE
jgi:hypothetical protein